jgi:uridine kinase
MVYKKVIIINKPVVIAVSGVTAGGKTTTINELKKKIKKSKSLHFDDYDFEGEVDNFYQWVMDGADYNVWNLEPLKKDILKLKEDNEVQYILIDYPFAYKNDLIKPFIDCAIFIDTPLDIAMARRVLRDMHNATGDEIREEMSFYLKYSRIAYEEMLKTIMPNSDYVIDGSMKLDEIVNQIVDKIKIKLSKFNEEFCM